MTLQDLLQGIAPTEQLPAQVRGATVRGLAFDSRKVKQGSLFFAFSGANVDGRVYAKQAMDQGAIAVVSDQSPLPDFQGPWIQVPHGRQALSLAAGRFFNHPDQRIGVTGVTGTNGKTTTTYLIDSILRAAGKTTALVGTIEYRLAGKVITAVNTTPESLEMFQILSDLERAGGTHFTTEASSHALALGRVAGLYFHTAVFTNLTRDHLDFHKTMEAYFAAKQMLFEPELAAPPRYAVINHDDAYGRALQLKPETEVLSYGMEEGSAIRAHAVSSSFEGLRFEVDFRGKSYPLESPLVGAFNVYNILAAWGTGFSYEIDPEVIAQGVRECAAVPGRFERVRVGQPFLVVVDYAHTDDALRNVIRVARALTKGRVITLFGCGGDRDRAKRPLMGEAAAMGSDFVVLTSDNPRSEDPLAIMNDALVGLRRHDTEHLIEPDRATAIRRAIERAQPGDVVILAGKGHETYQVLKDRTISFDDREVARSVLRQFGYGKK
ncbi:MAG TPA: UDP-N-acetylmuramoyl-L-alanyl-D-glutamate--2,6-diaminopimelate ligase [Bryobacteraceae bacterium]|nr:UDP-N-acetylmuramoyl-L-alanyl-D-glutamate--2,6-diaminopimelate ligase [Bryobacteraceae bacterium]